MFKSKDYKIVIYLVDDDDLQLKILQSKLESSTDYELHTFRSGEAFLEYILKNSTTGNEYPIVILDYDLKTKENQDAKDGIEVLKIVKAINKNISVIMLSMLEDVDIATAAMHYGAVTFVKKNENAFTRIHSNIQWIRSQKDLDRKKRSYTITIRLFLTVLIIFAILAAVYFLPEYLKD